MKSVTRIGSLVLGASLALAAGCAQEPGSDQTYLPLIAVADGVDQGLAGVYNTETDEVWFVSGMVDPAMQAAIDSGRVPDPGLVVMAKGVTLDLSSQDYSAVLFMGLEVDDEGRACIVDRDLNRWTITEFRVGTADELRTASEEYVPSVLPMECEEIGGEVYCADEIDVQG